MHLIQSILFLVGLWLTQSSYAVEVAGIHFDDAIQTDSGQNLVINGTGVRKIWLLKIYAAALYLPATTTDAASVLSLQGAKRVRMVFLYRKISAKKLAETFDKGFRDNHSKAQLKQFEAKLAQLKQLFKTVRKGDEVILDYQPGMGTQVYGNGELRGVIPGFEFNQALLRVWLGEKPADKKLKRDFLGG